MVDIIDKAILIGMGMEKKIKEFLDEMQKLGKADLSKEAREKGAEELPPKKQFENMVVEESVKCIKELLSTLKSTKEKLEEEILGSSERVLDKMHVATKEDVETVKEMARIAREKVDELEKKLKELEEKKKKKTH